jgi:hypothetical protein
MEDLLNFKDEEYLNLTIEIQKKEEKINTITKYY